MLSHAVFVWQVLSKQRMERQKVLTPEDRDAMNMTPANMFGVRQRGTSAGHSPFTP